MKKIVSLFLMWSAFGAFAQPKMDFHDGPLSELLKIAQAEDKALLFMGYADWCEHCKMMKTEVFTDPKVIEFYNKNFVCGWQDMESAAGMAIRKKYNVRAFPVFLFFDKSGELLYVANGEIKADNFIKEGQNALNPKMQLPYLKSQFDADVTNAENCLAYVGALRKANLDTDAVSQKYLSNLTEDQLVSNMNWKIIANGVRDVNSREFQYILKKQPEFAAVSSAKRVERKILNMVQEWLSPSVESGDTATYFKKRPPVEKIALRQTDSLLFTMDLKIMEITRNWKGYARYASAGVSKNIWNNAAKLKEIAKTYMSEIRDPKALNDAIGWAKRSLELNDAYDVHIIIARLYFYKGDKIMAKEWAEKARIMAQNLKFDTKQADDILNELR